MEMKVCKKCSKIIEGYSKKHVNYLMLQHKYVHRKKPKKKKKRR